MNADDYEPPPSKAGRPQHEPTDELRAAIEALAGHGLPQEDIAAYAKISKPTLMKYYEEEMRSGRVKANMQVAQSLFRKAVSDTHPQAATCAIFWARTQMGWKPPAKELNMGGAIGMFDVTKLSLLTDQELHSFNALLGRIIEGVPVNSGADTDPRGGGLGDYAPGDDEGEGG